jgi:hypothetical protein
VVRRVGVKRLQEMSRQARAEAVGVDFGPEDRDGGDDDAARPLGDAPGPLGEDPGPAAGDAAGGPGRSPDLAPDGDGVERPAEGPRRFPDDTEQAIEELLEAQGAPPLSAAPFDGAARVFTEDGWAWVGPDRPAGPDGDGVPDFPDPPDDLLERFEAQDRERRRPEPGQWRHRITRHESVDPRTLVPHPENWRLHPDRQRRALHGAIGQVGFVGEILASTRSRRILNGHLRWEEAIRADQRAVPVGWVDCESDEEERAILLSLDPVAELYRVATDRHRALLEATTIQDRALRTLCERLGGAAPVLEEPDDDPDEAPVPRSAPRTPEVPRSAPPTDAGGARRVAYAVIVECHDPDTQQDVLDLLGEAGYAARPVERPA